MLTINLTTRIQNVCGVWVGGDFYKTALSMIQFPGMWVLDQALSIESQLGTAGHTREAMTNSFNAGMPTLMNNGKNADAGLILFPAFQHLLMIFNIVNKSNTRSSRVWASKMLVKYIPVLD